MAFRRQKTAADSAEEKKGKEAHYFKQGQSGNPTGRPKGSRNQVSEAFLQDLLVDWETAGASAIARCRIEDPSTYLRIVAKLLPKYMAD